MPDMEALDRAVEEADRKIVADMDGAVVRALGTAGMRRLRNNVNALTAAVSARARAEEAASRVLVAHCRDCDWSRQADSGRWAEELRMMHEQAKATHNVWITPRSEWAAPVEGGG